MRPKILPSFLNLKTGGDNNKTDVLNKPLPLPERTCNIIDKYLIRLS